MPRETIQYMATRPVESTSDWDVEAIELPFPGLEVQWHRDFGTVQLSIEFARETWIGQAKDLEEQSNVWSRAIYTDNLSRSDINHLIRTLKRARNAAYGADE